MNGCCGSYTKKGPRCSRQAVVYWVSPKWASKWVGYCKFHDSRKRLGTDGLLGPLSKDELVAFEVQSS